MDLRLRDKVAAVTGASVGIGLAVAEALAAEGVHLVLAARQPARLANEARRIADHYGVRAVHIACDVATVDGAAALVSVVERDFGGADILINNAGTGSNETIMERRTRNGSITGTSIVMAAVMLARGLVPAMRRRGGGVILHNASICATQPLWYEPIYKVTKSALMMFSKRMLFAEILRLIEGLRPRRASS